MYDPATCCRSPGRISSPSSPSTAAREALRGAVEGAETPPALLSVLARYIQFNSAFGPGLANLAGEIAARQGLFRDRDEPVTILADRASEVAADFFYAAVDEFDDRATPWRDTHRTLAQATLKGMGAFFGYAPAAAQRRPPRQRRHRVRPWPGSWEGYGVGARLEEPRLFRAMGFHTGSEVLADQEFSFIDRVLHARRPDLVAALEAHEGPALRASSTTPTTGSASTPSVEAEHFDAALKGVNNALRFYVGKEPVATVKGCILDGFRGFADVQSDFMARLGEP